MRLLLCFSISVIWTITLGCQAPALSGHTPAIVLRPGMSRDEVLRASHGFIGNPMLTPCVMCRFLGNFEVLLSRDEPPGVGVPCALVQFDQEGRALGYGTITEVDAVSAEDFSPPPPGQPRRWPFCYSRGRPAQEMPPENTSMQVSFDSSKPGAAQRPKPTEVIAACQGGGPTGTQCLVFEVDWEHTQTVTWMAVLHIGASYVELASNGRVNLPQR